MNYLHTMIRVGDLKRSLQFYTDIVELKVRAVKEYPSGKFTNAFLGQETGEPFLELTHNWETLKYELGNAYGHMAFGVKDIYAACKKIEAQGGKVVRQPGPMKHGTTVIAFVEDPDGYKIELIQREAE